MHLVRCSVCPCAGLTSCNRSSPVLLYINTNVLEFWPLIAGTDGRKGPQWQQEGHAVQSGARRSLQQVSVDLPILRQLGAAVSSSPPSSPAAPNIASAVAPALSDLPQPQGSSAAPDVAQGSTDQHSVSSAAPAPETTSSKAAQPTTAQNTTSTDGKQSTATAAPPSQGGSAGGPVHSESIAAPASTISSLTAHAPAPVQAARGPDGSGNPNSNSSGDTGTPASPSPSLLSLLPAIMEVLNKENQSGSSGRSLNISVSAIGPNAPSNGDPGVSGNLANTKVEAGPRSVDVQVPTPPMAPTLTGQKNAI